MSSVQDEISESVSSQPVSDQENTEETTTTSASFFFMLTKRQHEEIHAFSSWHVFGGFRWRLFIFPKGNHTDSHLSIYLECGGPSCRDDTKKDDMIISKESDLLVGKKCVSTSEYQCEKHNPSTWEKSILFSVTLWRLDSPFINTFIEEDGRIKPNCCPKEGKFGQHFRSTSFTFSNTGSTDWGWLEFIELDELCSNSFTDKDGNCVFSTQLTENT